MWLEHLGFSSNVGTRYCDGGEGKTPARILSFRPAVATAVEAFQKGVLLVKCKPQGCCFGKKGANLGQVGDNSLVLAPKLVVDE